MCPIGAMCPGLENTSIWAEDAIIRDLPKKLILIKSVIVNKITRIKKIGGIERFCNATIRAVTDIGESGHQPVNPRLIIGLLVLPPT